MELKDIIKAKGLKNEYLIDRMDINRNKFYKALKSPSILSEAERIRLAELLNLRPETLTDLTK